MSSVNIPKWIGPALCPVVLILLIAGLCFYYCYWKPRREENKEKNQAEDKQIKKKTISPSSVRHSPRSKLIKDKNIRHVDEEMCYGYGYNDCDTFTTYAPYYMDYCPLPSSGMSYCVQYDCRPKGFYCPKTSYLGKSRDTTHDKCRPGTADKTRKCRVKCPRGECIKCPDLPMIKEGNSTLSLNCDEKEELTGSGLMCVCNDSKNEQMIVEDREKLEINSTSNVSAQGEDTCNCCRDSGFEDH